MNKHLLLTLIATFTVVAAISSGGLRAADSSLPASLLAAKAPEGAVRVVKAREKAKAGELIVLRGLIGGRMVSLTPKTAIAVLADEKAVAPCSANPNDACKTPWDYCCEKPSTRTEHALAVELRSADGKVLATPSLPDLRLLDEVDVVGKLSKDEHGNFVLAAEGVFRTARPNLPTDLRWPQ